MSYTAAFTGNLIGFVSGCALTWSSPEAFKLKDLDETPFERVITESEESLIGSLLPLGAAVGPWIFGYAADKYGRKTTILSLGIPFTICSLIMAFGKTIGLFYFSRFVTGMVVGGTFTVLPMYLGEIADDSNRGALGSSMNCFVCFGLFFSYAVGPYVSITVFNVILAIIPVAFIVLFYLMAPESPHYLLTRGKTDLAKTSLQKVRVNLNETAVEKELMEIESKIKNDGKGNFFDIFKSKGLTKAFNICIGLVAFQQLSGINVVLFYSQKLFESTGTSLKPEICSILVGGVQFGTSFLTPLVADKLGRRILLIISAVGMMASEVPIGIYSYLFDKGVDVSSFSWIPILSLIVYIITYNCGYGPLPWSVLGEMFPSSVKSIASSAVASICWFIGFLLTMYFSNLKDAIGIGPCFWLFAGFCGVAIFFSAFYVIETKGKSLSEIQRALDK